MLQVLKKKIEIYNNDESIMVHAHTGKHTKALWYTQLETVLKRQSPSSKKGVNENMNSDGRCNMLEWHAEILTY